MSCYWQLKYWVTPKKCYKDKSRLLSSDLTLFRTGLFGAAHGSGGRSEGKRGPKICHTYPTMMKLGEIDEESYTLPKEDPKKYINHLTHS